VRTIIDESPVTNVLKPHDPRTVTRVVGGLEVRSEWSVGYRSRFIGCKFLEGHSRPSIVRSSIEERLTVQGQAALRASNSPVCCVEAGELLFDHLNDSLLIREWRQGQWSIRKESSWHPQLTCGTGHMSRRFRSKALLKQEEQQEAFVQPRSWSKYMELSRTKTVTTNKVGCYRGLPVLHRRRDLRHENIALLKVTETLLAKLTNCPGS
jgi:hypothetical protein